MPMAEIRRRFTKSELYGLGWRSGELAYNMRSKQTQSHYEAAHRTPDASVMTPVVSDREIVELEARMGPVVHRVVDDKGTVDLARVTGDEAMHYLAALGIPMGGRA